MAEHNELGKKGEEAAVNLLISKGHRILERNWRRYGYEIDVISQERGYIVFTEVKTRSSQTWGNPEDFVDRRRMRRMVAAADSYMKRHRIDLPARFDIVAVLWKDSRCEMEHFEDAFLPFI